ncbi:HEAT repeat domain-containing protein [Sphingomonas psychrotolerans]|uniref:HEAT repeat domain-containing protein n=1 Tax=Sphingomonas psychrotolerans TaxID=1327635 RepID=A0A2K8ME10_9SPHN|nr:HEAT repeat domain-containing protein [Sphingomonas psychrotolerans]ATY31204.1 hypothetical protein CVN68_03765 [Sphingomonas psychrotolerans]
MKNLKDIMAVVTAPEFRPGLLEDNKRSVSYYNDYLGFGDLKRILAANEDMTPAEVFRLCDVFFTEDRIQSVVAEEQRCADRNPFYGSSFQPIGGEFFGGMVLASTDQFTAMLLALDGFEIDLAKQRYGERRTLTFGGQETYLKFFRAHEFPLQSWKIPTFGDDDDLHTLDLRFEEGDRFDCKAGESLHFKANESFEYSAKAGSHALVLQIQMYRGGMPMALEFDFDTRRMVGASSPAQEPTRLQMLATAMRLFGRQDSCDQLERLLEHPSHYVRWHTMREYLGLNLERAWPHLERMRDQDPQAAVRRAAQRTIEMLSEEMPAIAAE